MRTAAYSQRVAVAAPGGARTLVSRLKRREREAWDELYRLYEPRLMRFAYRLTGNQHDAADLVAETFLRVLPRLDKLDEASLNLSAYLFTTAKNLFLKQVERGARHELMDEVPEPTDQRPIEDEPERLTLLHRQQEDVRIANARLPARQRLVLALRELEERSYAEIGEIVGLKENAVAQLISRARESLRHELRLAQVDRSALQPDCQALLPLLSAHLDGHLTPAERERVLAHVETCRDCQDALLAMEEARRRYRSLLPPLTLGGGVKARLDRALDERAYWTRRPPRRFSGRWPLAAGATAAVVLAGTGYVVAHALSPHARQLGLAASTTSASTAGARLPRPRAHRVVSVPPHRPSVSTASGSLAAPSASATLAALATTTAATSQRQGTTAPVASATTSVTRTGPTPSASLSPALKTRKTNKTKKRNKTKKHKPAPVTPSATPELMLSSHDLGFTVENAGAGAAGAFSVLLSDGKSFRFSGLAAGASLSRSFACSGSPRTASIAPMADAAAGGVRVAVPPCPPSLTLVAAEATGFTVENAGAGAAAAFSVLFSDGKRFRFSGLAAGASLSRSFACAASARTASIAPAADAAAGGVRVAVPPCPPILTLSVVGASGFTVSNAGQGPAAAFSVLLSDGTSFPFAGLAAGASLSRSFACAASARTASIAPAADAAAGGVRVAVPPCPPILTLSVVGASGFTVSNAGQGPAAAFSVLLSDGTSFPFAGLAAGASLSRSFACAASARTASITPAGEAGAGGGGVAVPPCPPSLALSDTGATGFTVDNAGGGPAGAFSVLLSDGTSFPFAGLAAGASLSQSFACAASARTASIDPASDAAAGSATVPVPACPPPARASLTLACPGGGPLGAVYSVSGNLSPTVSGTSVSITYTPSRGSPVSDTVTTDPTGNYSDSFTPRTAGEWTAQAQFAGDATRQPAASTSCTFAVG